MIKEPAPHRETFRKLTAELIVSYETTAATEQMLGKPDGLSEGAQSVIKVCRAISTLVAAIPSEDTSISDVTDLKDSKSQSFVMTTIIDTLNKNTFWKKMYDELLSKGTASLEARPHMDELVTKLALLPSSGTCIPEEALFQITQVLPDWKKTCRPGFTLILEHALHQELLRTGELIKSEDAEVVNTMTMSYLDAVMNALGMFKTPECFAMVAFLQKFKVQQSKVLLVTDLDAQLGHYPEDDLEDFPIAEFPFSQRLASLHTIVLECKDFKLSEATLKRLCCAAFWQYKNLYLNMRDTRFAI